VCTSTTQLYKTSEVASLYTQTDSCKLAEFHYYLTLYKELQGYYASVAQHEINKPLQH